MEHQGNSEGTSIRVESVVGQITNKGQTSYVGDTLTK